MSVPSRRAKPAVGLSVLSPARDMRAFLVPDHKPNEQKGKMIFHYDTGPKSVNKRVFGNSVRASRTLKSTAQVVETECQFFGLFGFFQLETRSVRHFHTFEIKL